MFWNDTVVVLHVSLALYVLYFFLNHWFVITEYVADCHHSCTVTDDAKEY